MKGREKPSMTASSLDDITMKKRATTLIRNAPNPNETLLSAVKRHDVELVKKAVLQMGADVNYCPHREKGASTLGMVFRPHQSDQRNWSPLLEAVGHNYIDLVEVLFSLQADVKMGDQRGTTPLHLSSVYDRDSIASMLVENGSVVNQTNKHGQTPLHLAASKGVKMTKMLLLAGCDPSVTCNEGLSPLHEACKANNVEGVTWTLIAGGLFFFFLFLFFVFCF